MKLRKLAMILDTLAPHPAPSPFLEQYTIGGEEAARLLWIVKGDLEEKVVVDLGCGSGRLAIGAAILGASFVVGVDVDRAALQTAHRNAEKAGVGRLVSWVCASVPRVEMKADVVVQNPPFGVQRRGADRAFVECALKIAPTVYSLHKRVEGSRRFITKLVESLGGYATILATFKLRLPPLFEFHVEKARMVEVDLYRFTRNEVKALASPTSL
ncbi:MAG: RNA methyltransferase [Thermoprotei archaeon]|nr:MAG: RNA methyltransferase [Thermoprotei archaeon]